MEEMGAFVGNCILLVGLAFVACLAWWMAQE